MKNYEMSIAQRQLIGEDKNVRRREQIENFEGSKMLPEVKYYFLLYDVRVKSFEIETDFQCSQLIMMKN